MTATDPNTQSALLPCPFCGGRAAIQAVSGYLAISCSACGATPDRKAYKADTDAITAWNTRAHPPATGEAVAWRYRYRDDAAYLPWGLAEDVSGLNPDRYIIEPLYAAPVAGRGDREGVLAFDVEDYVEGYEYRADEDEGGYTPNENERALLTDAIHGVLSELSVASIAPPPQTCRKCKGAGAFWGGETGHVLCSACAAPHPQGDLDAISAAIGTVRFMDPPDGGDVSLAEQVRRMKAALDAAEGDLAVAIKALDSGLAVIGNYFADPDDYDAERALERVSGIAAEALRTLTEKEA